MESPIWTPLCVGSLHLAACGFARTQQRLDSRLLAAATIFMIAICMHALYADRSYAPLRPLLFTLSAQMMVPAVSAVLMDVMQHTLVRQNSRRPPIKDLSNTSLSESLASLHRLIEGATSEAQ
jgi:hypothetical protein